MLPEKTLASKNEISTQEYKRNKDRVMVIAFCNIIGEHKLKLCFIGKGENPCALKRVKSMNDLPL